MLIIRQRQIDAMTIGDEEDLVRFVIKHVKEENHRLKDDYSSEMLEKMVRGGIEKAKGYNFSTAEDLTVFVSIMFEVAPNFDEQPKIKAILDDERFQPSGRLERLWSPLTSEDDWEEAANNYNEEAWFSEKLNNTIDVN